MTSRHELLIVASFLSLIAIPKRGALAKTDSIDIVPGKSIGALTLGAPTESLPKGATVREFDGSYMGISFTHKDGKIDDVWIDDLRKMRHPIRWAGKDVPRHGTLKALKELFGPCRPVPGLKGGMSFQCDSGFILGCDFHGAGRFIQIRLLPDWGSS